MLSPCALLSMAFVATAASLSWTHAKRERTLIHKERNLREELRESQARYQRLSRDMERQIRERTAELRMKEEELVQHQKIEAIGRLAGGIAHDFNSILTGIGAIAEELRDSFDSDDPRRIDSEDIVKASHRAAFLTRQLLAFGRREVIKPVVMDLNRTIEEVTRMLTRLIGPGIQLACRLEPVIGLVRMDPRQVEQIVVNLVLNARDAMPRGGTITIRTSMIDQQVLLSIQDTGIGMDAVTREHAFEPFFTTKQQGRGSGLGLSTVYGIIKQNRGDILLESAPGLGTTIKIYLPCIETARLLQHTS